MGVYMNLDRRLLDRPYLRCDLVFHLIYGAQVITHWFSVLLEIFAFDTDLILIKMEDVTDD